MSLGGYEEAFLRVCFAAEPAPSDLAVLGDPARYLMYRGMVRSRLREMVESALPRTRAALGAERFAALVEDHLCAAPPRTRFIREVPVPFARALAERAATLESARPWLADLVELERARWEAIYHDEQAPTAAQEFDFERVPVLDPAHEVLSLGHAVHRDADADGGYAAVPTSLVVHRGRGDHAVGAVPVSGVVGAVVGEWAKSEETAMASVIRVASARGVPVDASLVDGLCTALASFIERGLVLGSA